MENSETINICFSIDKKFVDFCATSMVSVIKRSKASLNFFIVHDGSINDHDKYKITTLKEIRDFNLEFIVFDKTTINGIDKTNSPHISSVTYLRLMLPSILDNLSKVIYLDSDIIVEKDIKDLYDIPFDGTCILGCRSMNSEENSKRLGLKNVIQYINAGVMVIDLDKMRSLNIEEKFLLFLKNTKHLLLNNDQDVINYVLYKSKLIKLIPQNWNTEIRSDIKIKDNYKAIFNNPYIYHYITADKPWIDSSRQKYKEIWHKYYQIYLKKILKASFSIIMPTYNRKYCIKNAIDSLLKQTYQDFELIIIDDGSTDQTEEFIRNTYNKYLSDEKIRYIKLDKNYGVSFARNVGLENVKNEWVGYLDSDNEMLPIFLEDFAKQIVDNPEYKIFYAQTKYNNANFIFGREFDFVELLKGNFIDNNVLIHRIDLYKELGGFDISLERLVDWDLVIRYTERYEPFFIKKPLIRYNDRDDIHRITNDESFEKNFKKIIVNYFGRIPEDKFVETFLDNFKNHHTDCEEFINLIKSKEEQIKLITSSTAWKVTEPFRRLKDWVVNLIK